VTPARRVFHLAVVNSHPIQYFGPLYAYLNRDPDLEVTALYCSDVSLRGATDPGFGRPIAWDVDLLTGYRSIFLGEKATTRIPHGFWSLICPQLWSEIRGGQYDAVLLHGYNYAASVLALIAAKTMRLPVLMRSETHLALHGKRWRRRVRDGVLTIAYRFVDGFLAIGTANRAYYRALGVPGKRIFDLPYAVDNERFIAGAGLTPEQLSRIRRKYGLPMDDVVVLYASKFMRRKHPDDMIRAMAGLRDKGHTATLFMVGAGEMEQELRDLTARLGMANVVFSGFLNQAELPGIYAASDVFVLPSDNEPWGLVVNEVMCAGIPVVVSDEVGCVADLVKDGVNGYHMKAGDILSLSRAIEKLVADEHQRKRMGVASRSIIDSWGYEQCRQGMTAALAGVCR
jgi:glycosyltransferase involved in cell wall biosynthesis